MDNINSNLNKKDIKNINKLYNLSGIEYINFLLNHDNQLNDINLKNTIDKLKKNKHPENIIKEITGGAFNFLRGKKTTSNATNQNNVLAKAKQTLQRAEQAQKTAQNLIKYQTEEKLKIEKKLSELNKSQIALIIPNLKKIANNQEEEKRLTKRLEEIKLTLQKMKGIQMQDISQLNQDVARIESEVNANQEAEQVQAEEATEPPPDSEGEPPAGTEEKPPDTAGEPPPEGGELPSYYDPRYQEFPIVPNVNNVNIRPPYNQRLYQQNNLYRNRYPINYN